MICRLHFERRVRRTRFGFLAAAATVVCSAIRFAGAASPTLEHLYPAGGTPGSTNLVALAGKFEPWPPRFWVESSGIEFSATTNTGKVVIRVAPDAVPGPRWIRVYSDEGASDPRLFVVGTCSELQDTEPNNTVANPQSVTALPVTIQGRLDKNGDVDSFAVPVRSGQWLVARLDAYSLMSKLDAVLRLVGTNGQPLAWNHDHFAFDPRVVWQAPTDRTVVVQVFGFKYPADSSIQLAGGEGAVYQLHLSSHADCPVPLVPPPPTDLVLEPPIRVEGSVGADAPATRHRFRASKDELLEIRLDTVSSGSRWDARLRIEDLEGKELAQNDDGDGTSDPRLDWRPPSDGTYTAVVASRTATRVPGRDYALSLRRAVPAVVAKSSAGSFIVRTGSTNEVKIGLNWRHGFTNEVALGFAGLPDGVQAAVETAAPGKNEVSLKLIATQLAPASSGPVSIWIAPIGSNETNRVAHDLVSRGENNGVPQGYSRLLRESIDALWLAVVSTNRAESGATAKP